MPRTRRAINLLAGQYWALEPEKLDAVAQLVEDLTLGRPTDGSMFASVAGEDDGMRRPYALESGVAIIPVDGVIAFRMNMFQAISGGTSTELIGKRVRQAARDSGVEAILLDISSPGGAVHGLADLARDIRKAAASKPVIAWTGENMCSAAYWIGSAASEIVCSTTACVGSIGVYCIHVEISGKDAKDGVTRTIFKAGRFKALGNDAEPLGDDARAVIQERVDEFYSLFVSNVADNLGRNVQEVLDTMADGRTHIGEKALQQGFVHHLGDKAFAIARALELARTHNQEADTMPAGSTPLSGSGAQPASGSGALDLSALTAEQLKQHNPDLAAALAAEGRDQERARVLELFEAKADGDATMAAVKDGAQPGAFFKATLVTERDGRARGLEAMQESLSDSVGQDGKASASGGGKDFMALVQAHMAEAGCSKGEAIKAMGRQHPDIHQAWLGQEGR